MKTRAANLMKFNSTPKQGYKVVFRSSGSINKRAVRHLFCGRHKLAGAGCPNCHKPLLRLFALNTLDPQLGFNGLPYGTLSLLWCWTCNIAQKPFFYRQLDAEAVKILRYARGGATRSFPYADYPIAFRGRWCVLEPIDREVESSIRAYYRRSGSLPLESAMGHQVGGVPFLWRDLKGCKLMCPVCRGDMPFLAVISDDAGKGTSICGNSALRHVFHLCHGCGVVGAYQDCD